LAPESPLPAADGRFFLQPMARQQGHNFRLPLAAIRPLRKSKILQRRRYGECRIRRNTDDLDQRHTGNRILCCQRFRFMDLTA
jgi:hypothetical protein